MGTGHRRPLYIKAIDAAAARFFVFLLTCAMLMTSFRSEADEFSCCDSAGFSFFGITTGGRHPRSHRTHTAKPSFCTGR